MNLSFDSVSELDEFLNWAADYRGHTLTVPQGVTSLEVHLPRAGSGGGGGAAPFGDLKTVGTAGIGGVFTAAAANALTDAVWPAGDAQAPADEVSEPGAQPPAEPTKRKRRTKAEIEADAAKAREGAQGGQNAGEAALEAARAVLRDKEQPAGANPFEQSAEDKLAAAVAEVAAVEAAENAVTPFQHLTRARSFIAAHGMLKYNESFAKAGLDANVMAYTAEQRAQHLAALDELEKA